MRPGARRQRRHPARPVGPTTTTRPAPARDRRRDPRTSSMPTDSRTMLSVRPICARRSIGTLACVIDAGWQTRLSTPPRLSASANTLNRSSTVCAPLERADVERRSCRRSRASGARPARAADGSRARGSAPRCTFGCAARNRATREAVGVVPLHAHGERLGAAQHEPRVERPQDGAGRVLHELQPLDVLVAHCRRRCRRRCRCGRSGTSSCCGRRCRRRARAAAGGTGSRRCCRRPA